MSEIDKEQTYVEWLRQNATSHDTAGNSDEPYQHGWEIARKAARILKEQFGVHRVRVFGSLIHEGRFHPGSDVDLAVEGLIPAKYWEALTSVMFLDDQVSVEMVDQATCRPDIWSIVEQEGIDL